MNQHSKSRIGCTPLDGGATFVRLRAGCTVWAAWLACCAANASEPDNLPVVEIAPGQPGEFVLSWLSAIQRPYQLQTSVDLSVWEDQGNFHVGTGALLEVPVAQQGPKRFYRIREGAVRPGFDALAMTRGDDHSYAGGGHTPVMVNLGFPINFFGVTHTACFVNNNGNITFDAPLFTYTPESLIKSRAIMIAPYWADVDTRNLDSDVTRFSAEPTLVNGRQAFGVSWRDVGYFSYRVDKTNTFQLVMVERGDRAAGDFDIEFNYNRIRWETGDASGGTIGFGGSPARVGWTNGNGLFMEFKGSGTSLELLDSKVAGLPNFENGLIYQNWNSGVPGRILIRVVNGLPETEPGLNYAVNAGPDVILGANAGRDINLSATITPPETTGLTYSWALESGPEGVTFVNGNTLNPVARISEPGDYVFRAFAVKQAGFIASSSDSVTVTHPGVFYVSAGGNYNCAGASPCMIRLNAASATFNDNNVTRLHWKQTSGKTATLLNSSSINPDVVLPEPGSYQFSLTATSDHVPAFEKTSVATVVYGE